MKKKILISTGLTGIIAVSVAVGSYAASDIKLLINGKSVATDIQIIDGSSYVPLRVVSESLGADVKWDGDSRTIIINQGGNSSAQAPKSNVKTFNVSVNIESGPIKMNIAKVTLDPAYKTKYSDLFNAIILDVSVENTSTDSITWHPNQGTIVLNTKEQVDANLFNSEDVGGEFIGKVIKTGKIVFSVKSDLTKVESINFKVSGAHNSKTYSNVGPEKTSEIILK